MAEIEQRYLARCRANGICPACHNGLAQRIGSGKLDDGIFCSLACYAKWHSASLVQRHRMRTMGPCQDE
jgi:hypothetical protein